MNHYSIYGLRLVTDLNLPLPLANSKNTRTDVVLRKGEFPAKTDKELLDIREVEDFQRSEIYQSNDGKFETYVYRENNCSLYVKDGCEVIIHPETDLEKNKEHFAFFSHIAFSSILYHRKCLLFHGSAVAYNEKGYLFLGHSGAGKSTTASSLINEGGKFLTDDICMIYQYDNEYYIAPSYNFIKVTPMAFKRLQNIDNVFSSYTLLTEGKYLCQLHQDNLSTKAIRLNKIFHIKIDDQKITHFSELKGADKLKRLVNNGARPEGLKRYHLEADFYKECFLLNSKIPVIDIYRKHDEFITDELINYLDQNN